MSRRFKSCFRGEASIYLFSSESRWESRSDVSRLVHFVHANRKLNSREDTLMAASRQLTVRVHQTWAWFFLRISWIAWKRSSIFTVKLKREINRIAMFDSIISQYEYLYIGYRNCAIDSASWIIDSTTNRKSFMKTEKFNFCIWRLL